MCVCVCVCTRVGVGIPFCHPSVISDGVSADAVPRDSSPKTTRRIGHGKTSGIWGPQKHKLLLQRVLLRRVSVEWKLSESFACRWSQGVAYRLSSSSGDLTSINSLLCSHTILRTSRWVSVESNRYLQEKCGYIASVCEVGEELVCMGWQDKQRSTRMEMLLCALHADALVALMEYLATHHPRCLFLRSQKGGSSTSSRSSKASHLCDALLSALACRSVELSSKHVAFIGAIYSASGIDPRFFSLILYHCQKSIRRTQAVQTLRALCLMRSDADNTMLYGSTACDTRIHSTALSFLLVRCMKLEAIHEGYDTKWLLCRALMRHFSNLHPDVRMACLWRLRRGITREGGDEKGKIADEAMLSHLMDINIGAGPSPPEAFAAMEAAGRSLILDDVNSAHLISLVKKKSVTCCSTRLPASPATSAVLEHVALPIHQQLLLAEHLHGVSKLAALETLSQDVLQESELNVLLGIVDRVVCQCPSLCQVLVHRILQLSFYDDGDASASDSADSRASLSSVLTALHRLLPYVDVLDLLESTTVYGWFSETAPQGSPSHDMPAPVTTSLVKCVAMHIPAKTIPSLFRRMERQRELAAFRLPTFVLTVMLQALEYMTLDSLLPEEVESIYSFVQQERRKRVPKTQFACEEGEQRVEDGVELLAAMEKRAIFRQGSTLCSGTVSPLCPPLVSCFQRTNITADGICHTGFATVALVEMFGPKAVKLVTPEVAVQDYVALAWLYAIYRMSISVICELEALAVLAVCQGVQLRISDRQRILVEVSESSDERMALTDSTAASEYGLCRCVEEWLLGGAKGDFAFTQLLTTAAGDKLARSFISYVALARQDTAAMRKIQDRSWSSASIFRRVGCISGSFAYRMPVRYGDENKACMSAGTGDNIGAEGDTSTDDLIAASTHAVQFAKERQWSSTASAPIDVARLWAYGDLLLLERDRTRKLEHYKEILQLCQGNGHAAFLQNLPANIHSDIFAWAGGKGLWLQGLSLLHLAEGVSREFQLPLDAYQEVMRACLMYRIPTPAFIREKIRGNHTS